MSKAKHGRFVVDDSIGTVSFIFDCPPGSDGTFILAHGAGAGMQHPFMSAIAERLTRRRLAVFRYQFPYMEAGKKPPNRTPVLTTTVRAAIERANRLTPDAPLLAGGKSMGGRMTSTLIAAEAHPRVCGLAFLGFPLHPSGKTSVERGKHLADVEVPMLFVQGTRDALADLKLLRRVIRRLGHRATLHIVDSGDHSFHVLKRSGRNHDEVLDEIADAIRSFFDQIV